MRTNLATIALATIAAALIAIDATNACAQPFPSRPVKAIIDVGIGGTYDIFARTLGEELHKKWGQPVVVEPRPGGMGIVGTRACAEATPDGYNICVLSNAFVINEFLYKTLPYSRASFSPVMNLFYNTQVIVASA